MAKIREHWGSRMGFVLAAAGSAIGLGNLWKFPYITWHNNGGAFVLVYLICILVVGLPIMMAEILIGRRAQKSAVPAFEEIGHKKWNWIGVVGVLAGFVILGYYSVIAGWSITTFIDCVGWSINGYTPHPDGAFGAFISDGKTQLGLSAVFSVATLGVVWFGISGGIEKVTKFLMPTLFLILIYFVISSFSMSGFKEAMTFLFKPNFSELPATGVLEALGHAFFTLSLGMGLMITYGSYLTKEMSVTRVSAMVVIMDTVVALIACVIMFTIIYSTPGLSETIGKSTVGMLFVTLPTLFYSGSMPGGSILGPLFYLLVAFAALTSTISLLEVMVSYFIDARGWTRAKSSLVCAGGTFVNTIFCALSLGAVGFLSTFSLVGSKAGVLDHLDYLASNWMLPIGGFGIALFAGWILDKKVSMEELGMMDSAGQPNLQYKIWRLFIRYVAPVAIAAVIVAVMFGKDFS